MLRFPASALSSLSVCFSVSVCEALAGSVRLTSSSGRSDEGKNSPCINVVPYTDSPSAASAIPRVASRWRSTVRRSRPYPRAMRPGPAARCFSFSGSSHVPVKGENRIATTHEFRSAISTTANSEKQYSPALDEAKPTGINPAIMTSVPVNIGNAVVWKAYVAACRRVSPASSRDTMVSTAIMASSTSSPSATIRAPREMRCRPMPASSIPAKVNASTSGIAAATTSPALNPSETKETASTISTASTSTRTNPLTAPLTTADWSATLTISMPCGSPAPMARILLFSVSPKRSILPVGAMEIASPTAGRPLTRNAAEGGSAALLSIVAISVRGR